MKPTNLFAGQALRTHFLSEVAEMALAHAIGSKVKATYRRGDLFNKRRRLMETWAEYCAKVPAKKSSIIALRAR